MDFYLAARTNGAIVLSLAVAGVLLFWFGAPDSAGIQVVATLVLTASLILFLLPGSLRRARERQALLPRLLFMSPLCFVPRQVHP